MKKNVFTFVIAGLIILFTTHCTNPGKSSKNDNALLDVKINKTSLNNFESTLSAPSPEEIMMLFDDSGLEFNLQALNNNQNISKYISSKSLSCNLGVYVTDAAYLNLFKEYALMSGYLESIFKITDKLGLSAIYTKFDFKKVFMEMDKPDSLIILADGIYLAVTDHMTETNNEPILCLISYGSFIELLHLAFESMQDFKSDDPILQRISDQQMQLDNLYEFASQFSDNADVAEMLTQLERIQNIWSLVEQTEKATQVSNNNKGEMSIGGGTKHNFTIEQFNELRKTIQEIRTKIIS